MQTYQTNQLLSSNQQQQATSASVLNNNNNNINNNSNSNNNNTVNNNNMASFVARLMSLNAQELQCLHADSELMRQLTETHLLMETRLQHIQLQNKLQLFQQQQQYNHNNQIAYLDHYYQQLAQVHNQQQQQQFQHQQQQQAHIEPSDATSLANILNPASVHQLALDLRTQQQQQTLAQQQQWAPVNCLLNFATAINNNNNNNLHNQTISSSSTSSSPIAGHSTKQTTIKNHNNIDNNSIMIGETIVNPKKLKLSEYQRSHHQDQHNSGSGSGLIGSNLNSSDTFELFHQQRGEKRLREFDYNSNLSYHNSPSTTNTTKRQQTSNNKNNQHQCHLLQQQSFASNLHTTQTNQMVPVVNSTAKKYKGEFDEPTPEEVEQRQMILARQDNYHYRKTKKLSLNVNNNNDILVDKCACVLGSEFQDKTVQSVLEMIDKWRHLPTEERIKTKWDVTDLPKDIPLSDIKKYEDLRREASNGRADFGGASKRKPLGIRGTRQFLLILYCLWGHPGRDDVMQKEGYCPHCFAKFKKANEQSTLVRVVNHFNMKHRRGANPRLSPHRDTPVPVSTTTTTNKSNNTTTNLNNNNNNNNNQPGQSVTTTNSDSLVGTARLLSNRQQQAMYTNDSSSDTTTTTSTVSPSPQLASSIQQDDGHIHNPEDKQQHALLNNELCPLSGSPVSSSSSPKAYSFSKKDIRKEEDATIQAGPSVTATSPSALSDKASLQVNKSSDLLLSTSPTSTSLSSQHSVGKKRKNEQDDFDEKAKQQTSTSKGPVKKDRTANKRANSGSSSSKTNESVAPESC